ncbi:diguanylate cyclase domain-containing protein [Rhodoferax sp.]|uniref:diguanylate cyclase domain-containing protein n=1 Tax=Rhodoferax sp. TaxID=50421 RepID=UPI0028421487|nr:diguanylate cyclase [Rhodoferax sp.]MDR3370268.1 diguanylate cyclase [Rhodoferax sp.]
MSERSQESIGRQSARAILRYAITALVVVSVLTLALLAMDTASTPLAFLGPLSMLGVGLMSWWWLSCGQINRSIISLVYGVCLAATGIAVFTGGINSPIIPIFPVLILNYGWLSNTASTIRLTLLITALSLALWAAKLLGILPMGMMTPSSSHIMHLVILYALSAALTAFIMRAYKHQIGELDAMSEELAGYTQLLEQTANLMERAQSVANLGSWFGDLVTDEITPSAQGCKIMGIPSGTSTNYRGYIAMVHESDRQAVTQAWQTALKNGTLDIEHRIIANGAVHWVRQKAKIEYAPDATPISALGIVQDITAHKLTQLALKASEERYRTLIEWTPEAILVHRNTHIMYANPAALKLFGASSVQSLLRKRTTDLIHPDFRPTQLARMESIKKGEPLPPSTETRFLQLDGSPIDVEVQGTAIEFDGEPAIHVSIRDITQRKHLEREIRQLAFYDSLTSLPNRRLLDDRLRQAISANRRSGHFGALMFLDLDNFKPLNDKYGHAVGDLLLAQAAMRLTRCVREMDTVARFGGDEFVVLLAELDTDWQKARQYAETVAEKIKSTLASPYSLSVPSQNNDSLHVEHHCTASIGIAVFASANADVQEITKWADAAMYQAKNEGRNRICLSEHSTDEVVNHYFFDSSFSLMEKG